MIKHKIKKTIFLTASVFSSILISTSCTNTNNTDNTFSSDELKKAINEAQKIVNSAKQDINNYDKNDIENKEKLIKQAQEELKNHEKYFSNQDKNKIDELIKKLLKPLAKKIAPSPNPAPKPNPVPLPPNPSPKPNPKPEPGHAGKELKLGFWNVANYGSKAYYKTQAIASIIYKQQFDLIGLAEIDSDQNSNYSHIDDVIKLLNEQEQSVSSFNKWKYIISDKYQPAKGYQGQADSYIGMLYKENMIEPVAFEDGKVGKFYDNSTYVTPYGGHISNYNRPPYGVKFKFKNNNITNNDFTYMIAHFDGPGVKRDDVNEIKYANKNGSSEMNEAASLEKVFEWFDEKDGDNKDLIFAGDTNINENNHNEAFKWVYNSNKKYINIFEPKAENNSSLRHEIGQYANSYDKIIHSGDIAYKNPYIYKLYEFVNDNSFLYSNIDSLEAWKEYIETKYNNNQEKYKKLFRYIYNGISDHCPVGYTLAFS
ncbi:endonuclease/exonuclease/phosphatase family protein [Mycoplasmopsis primatum]|uniref:endonuclease/exonuclease/phosphatase family protein n=1 Tax=Mycoplasmopsis primatum TaxID=55604 RepID=UPI000690FD12|nr:endonuclease/exonuclease/phosphatase family protein [Mycoplasmopsis primatum]